MATKVQLGPPGWVGAWSTPAEKHIVTISSPSMHENTAQFWAFF